LPADEVFFILDQSGSCVGSRWVDQEVGKPAMLSVLLAEDNLVNQKVASALLGKIGHRVTVANNGQEALDAVKAGQFDVVLMDIQMPVMDGLAATAAIRALPDPAKSQIPIFAISANVRDDEIADYRAQGITEILTKPLRPDRLKALLDHSKAPEPVEMLLDQAQLNALKEALPPAKLAELFDLARKSLQDSHAALQEGWNAKDLVKIKAAAHRLAGVARNFGCLALGERAARIENLAVRGDDGGSDAAGLEDLLAATLAALPQ
jgi:CheY-like chemotaxis protein